MIQENIEFKNHPFILGDFGFAVQESLFTTLEVAEIKDKYYFKAENSLIHYFMCNFIRYKKLDEKHPLYYNLADINSNSLVIRYNWIYGNTIEISKIDIFYDERNINDVYLIITNNKHYQFIVRVTYKDLKEVTSKTQKEFLFI